MHAATYQNSIGSRTQKRGFTLTEIAIVLGIIGLILGAIWSAAASVYANHRVSTANRDVLTIAQGMRGLYATQSALDVAYKGALMTPNPLDTLNIIPPEIQAAGPFPNGTTGVVGDTDANGFLIEMTAVPQAQCSALLLAVGGNVRDAGLFQATAVANAAPAAADAVATGNPLTTSVTTAISTGAAAAGEGGCTNTLNKVQFGFSLH